MDELYVYLPLTHVKRMYYLDEDFYHYFIGRADQSVHDDVMLRRIDQALLVNRLLVSSVDPYAVAEKRKRAYMLNYLEIVTGIACDLLMRSGTEEHLEKKRALWAFIQRENPRVYQTLRHRLTGRLIHLPDKAGRIVAIMIYKICRLIFEFN